MNYVLVGLLGMVAFVFPRITSAQVLHELPAITVTVDKTERTLQEIPSSVAVLNGLDIEREGIIAVEQLQARVPGLSFQPFGMSGVNSPVMRGLTANFNSLSTSTLLLIDGVPTLTAQGFEHDFADVQHVEVLRGPQSTLYGRNAESGVIAIDSQPMDAMPRAHVTGEAGSRSKQALRFAVARALVEDTLYASLSGSWMQQDGFVSNIHTGKKADDRQQRTVNLGLRLAPNTATDAVLRHTYQDYDDGAAPWGAPTSPRRQVYSGTAGFNRSKGQTTSLTLQQQFSPDLRLHAITAYNDYYDRVQQDTDFQPVEMRYIGRNHHFRTLSQEIRLHGTLGPADWLLGIYGDRSNNHLHTISYNALFGLANQRAQQKNHTASVFTHWNLSLAEKWTATAGVRIEHMAVHLSPLNGAEQKRHWSPISPKLALQYRFSMRNQAYVSASRGVRTGGFNTLAPMLNYLPFAPEKLWSWETGFKGNSANGRMRYTLAAYWMDIKAMQVMQMPAPGMMYITNAATATSKGVEIDMEWLLSPSWQWRSGLAWNQTRFDHFIDGNHDYSGKHNPFAPAFTGHLGLRYENRNGWYAQASLRASSKVYLDAANKYKRNGYGQFDLTTGIIRGALDFSVYAKNLNDKTLNAIGYQNGFVTVYSPPREIGLRLTWRM